MNDYLKIFIDGACQPNPGKGGIGVFIDSEEINEEISFSLPESSPIILQNMRH